MVFSLTNEKTSNVEMAEIMNLRPDGVKSNMRKIMKSSFAKQYITKHKKGNRNIYTNSISKDINVEEFVKKLIVQLICLLKKILLLLLKN